MQAIQVKFLPKTNRYKAFCAAGKVVIDPVGSLSPAENALQAANALKHKLDWHHPAYDITGSGQLYNGDYVFTMRGKQ